MHSTAPAPAALATLIALALKCHSALDFKYNSLGDSLLTRPTVPWILSTFLCRRRFAKYSSDTGCTSLA